MPQVKVDAAGVVWSIRVDEYDAVVIKMGDDDDVPMTPVEARLLGRILTIAAKEADHQRRSRQ